MFSAQEALAKIVNYEDGKVHHTIYYKDIEQARVQYKEYLDVGWKEEDYKLFLRKGTRWVL